MRTLNLGVALTLVVSFTGNAWAADRPLKDGEIMVISGNGTTIYKSQSGYNGHNSPGSYTNPTDSYGPNQAYRPQGSSQNYQPRQQTEEEKRQEAERQAQYERERAERIEQERLARIEEERKQEQRRANCRFYFQNEIGAHLETATNACLDSKVLQSTESFKSDEFTVGRNEYRTCVLTVNKELKDNRDVTAYVIDCAYRNKLSILIDVQADYKFHSAFKSCFTTAKNNIGNNAQSAYSRCLNPSFTKLGGEQNFWTCSARLPKLDIAISDYSGPCTTDQRHMLASVQFGTCMDRLLDAQLPKKLVYQYCSDEKSSKQVASEYFPKCKDKLQEVGVMGVNQTLLCTNQDLSIKISDQEARACIANSVRATHKNYLYLSVTETKDGKDLLYFLNKDCKMPERKEEPSDSKDSAKKDKKDSKKNVKAEVIIPALPEASPYMRLIKDINIHSREVFEDRERREAVFLGGISGLAFNAQTNELYTLSDFNPSTASYQYSQKPARIHVFHLNSQFNLEEKNLIYFTGERGTLTHMDSEGLVLTHNGNFMVSSEYGEDDKGISEAEKGFNISYFNQYGKSVGNIAVPENFITKYEETDREKRERKERERLEKEKAANPGKITNSVPPANTDGKDGSSDGAPAATNTQTTATQSNAPLTHQPVNNDEDTNWWGGVSKKIVKQGLMQNQSLESLTMNSDESAMYIANEGPMIQDSKSFPSCKRSYAGSRNQCGGAIHIVKYVKNDKAAKDKIQEAYKVDSQYKYVLENEPANGVSEMLSLDDDILLVLERSWNEEKKKVTARIFMVKLQSQLAIQGNTALDRSDKVPALAKTLVVDFDNVQPHMSPGFRWLENFEAMALGPKLTNGNQTLIVAADNNFSLRQRTVVLFFELKPEFFGLIKSLNKPPETWVKVDPASGESIRED